MGTESRPPVKFSRYTFLLVLFIAILILSSAVRNPFMPQFKKHTYSQFIANVEDGKVQEVTIMTHQSELRGALKNGDKFTAAMPDDPDLVKLLREKKVNFKAENPGVRENLTSFITMMVIPVLVIFGIWFLFLRQASIGGAQAMSFGRSRAKMVDTSAPKVTFKDVAGVDEAKEELEEIVEFLKDTKRFQTLGAKIPKGVLLVGPPGSGKTLLARAIAGEAKVPFFHMSGSDFVEMFVGVGASRVRDLFDTAKKNAPCLVFVDEIDAVGRQRGAGLGGGHDEREQTLNQLLVEMDGFDPNAGVILIAATNRPDVLDPALLRPGRFDRRVVVDRPDVKGRKAILEVHARGKPLDSSVDLEVVARRTPGFTGADLANILNEAAILAARDGEDAVTMKHIEEAIDRCIAGPERKSKLISESEKKITAYHEAGHALAAKLLPGTDPVHKISILPRGIALGYTLQLPLEDRYMTSRTELLNDMVVLLGGRVSEEIIFGEITTGASNDLERVTKVARKMVTEFGMSEKIGPVTLGKKHEAIFLGRDLAEDRNYSEEVAAEIDKEVRHIVDECYNKAKELLQQHQDRLELVAETLIEHETLEGVRLETLLEGKRLSDEDIAQIESEKR
ncbi:MAG: ATP-dependent zinc metalloprotease FtsH, partial [bacterium]